MKSLQLWRGVWILAALASVLGTGCARRPPGPPGPPARTQPSPFQFEIEALTLRFGDRVVLHDEFRGGQGLRPMEMEGRALTPSEAPRYRVSLGGISDANVRDGVLRLDQRATSNILPLWNEIAKRHDPSVKFEPLAGRDVHGAMLTLPIDLAGETAFVAREAFGLEYSVRIRAPRFTGFERLKIGLVDAEVFKSLAAISVGRLPTPFPPFPGPGGPGGPKIVNIFEMVSNPAIVLGRVEEPDIRGEIVLDHAELEQAGQIETLEMTLQVGRQGELSGLARVTAGGQTRELRLSPRSQEPREFFEPRSRLSPDVRLEATLFVETLPRPEVFRVEPSEVPAGELGREEGVRFQIHGIGFGPDTRVELVPEGVEGEPIRAEGLQLERQPRGPEGALLLANIGVRDVQAKSFTLRVTTGGQSAVLRNAVRVI